MIKTTVRISNKNSLLYQHLDENRESLKGQNAAEVQRLAEAYLVISKYGVSSNQLAVTNELPEDLAKSVEVKSTGETGKAVAAALFPDIG